MYCVEKLLFHQLSTSWDSRIFLNHLTDYGSTPPLSNGRGRLHLPPKPPKCFLVRVGVWELPTKYVHGTQGISKMPLLYKEG